MSDNEGELRSTVVSVFVESDTTIKVMSGRGDVWETLRFGDGMNRVDLFIPTADLQRLRDVIDDHLRGEPS